MDKNTITGLVLIGLLLVGYSFWSSSQQPAPTEQTEQSEDPQSDATAAGQPQGNEATKSAASGRAVQATSQGTTADSTALFAGQAVPAALPENQRILTLENQKIFVEVDRRGGAVRRVYLKEYKNYQDFVAKKGGRGAWLLLYDDRNAAMNFAFDTKEGTVNTRDYLFDRVESDSKNVLTLSLTAADGASLAFVYELQPDNYMLNFRIEAQGMSRHIPASAESLHLTWQDKVRQYEKGFDFENRYSTLTYKLSGDGTESLSETSSKEEDAEGAVDWVAFKNQYFSSILICSDSEMQGAHLRSRQIEKSSKEESGFLKDYDLQARLPLHMKNDRAQQFQFYFGPNNYNLLSSMDEHRIGEKELDLQELVYLGWPVVRWINRFFTIYVFDYLTRLGLNMGIVLLLITLLLRVIVYAPTKKSFLSSAKMRVLKPKVDEIARKYPNKEDAMRRQQETMALYSQYGASPMGGCLPMLLQMPIWIAMFNFVPNAIELRQQPFLWAEDLSTYDSLLHWNVHIWGIGDHLSLFCLLFCATNLLYSYMTMRQQRETMSGEQAQQMQMMQWMMFLMPVFFFFMFNEYSAGLNYYYFISLLASALTMWYLRRTTDDARLLRKLEATYQARKNDPNRKPSGLAARLEALQRQQEELAQAQKRRGR